MQQQLAFKATANFAYVMPVIISSVFFGLLSDNVGRRKSFIFVAGLIIAAALLLAGLSPTLGT